MNYADYTVRDYLKFVQIPRKFTYLIGQEVFIYENGNYVFGHIVIAEVGSVGLWVQTDNKIKWVRWSDTNWGFLKLNNSLFKSVVNDTIRNKNSN